MPVLDRGSRLRVNAKWPFPGASQMHQVGMASLSQANDGWVDVLVLICLWGEVA